MNQLSTAKISFFLLPALLAGLCQCAGLIQSATAQEVQKPDSQIEKQFITHARQITFEGRRAGEGYFSPDGSKLVFQSERRADNPFFQIYLLDFETGDIEPISPGHGKTTCAWIHPDGNRVLFSSTQDDPQARQKQIEEFKLRESGNARRYSWDYDPTYEIFALDRKEKTFQPLTNTIGYDAESSYSPDGTLIAFASNRNGYLTELDDATAKKFEQDPAYLMEIYLMNADGSNVRQLTDVPGYDGGPFFSPDGTRICWRRFSENGATAEIMTMKLDGTDQKTLTHLGAMSWAPFYHPSGEYLVFTTNKHGFANFELYVVAVAGRSEPIRITDTPGFDGLASFTPDGKQLTWTSNRNAQKQSQIYLGRWNHQAILKQLSNSPKLQPAPAPKPSVTAEADDVEADEVEADEVEADEPEAAKTGLESAKAAAPDFDFRDIVRHVDYLCRTELNGRMTGSPGEKKATAYVAAYMDYLGLKPAGENGTWFQKFEFPDGAETGDKNSLAVTHFNGKGDEVTHATLDTDWRPLTFSGNVSIPLTDVVFGGYGIVAPPSPEKDDQPAYDSYADLDVTDKWVMIFRFVPENVTPQRRQHLQFYAGLRKKAFFARDRGALGILVVSGPNSQVRKQLVPLVNDFSPSRSSIAAISVSDALAQTLLQDSPKNLQQLQNQLDAGQPEVGFDLPDVQIGCQIDIKKNTGIGRNVIGRLQAGDVPSNEVIVVGAHIDHLGAGSTASSLAQNEERGAIHRGADDNASGVAGMLEIAEYLVTQRKQGKLELKRDVIFAAWSGEELGLYGSKHFVDDWLLKKGISRDSLTLPTGSKSSTVQPTDETEQPSKRPEKNSFHDFIIRVAADGTFTVNDSPQTLDELKKDFQFIGQNAPDFVIEVQSHPTAKPETLQKIIELGKNTNVKHFKTSVLPVEQPDAPSPGPEPPVPAAVNSTGIVAALNMDMIGRFNDKLVLQGIGSSDDWAGFIESKNAVVGLPLTLSNETDLPTDASSFYQAGIPILSAFTGSHTDYHTPRDTPDKLDYENAARIAKLMGLITRSLATTDALPDYIRHESKPKPALRGGLRAYLGSVPSYGDDVIGVKLSDVTAGAPAELAGVQAGDIIVELAGKKIENIYDYTAVIDGLKIGQETSISIKRDGKTLSFKITPGSRQ